MPRNDMEVKEIFNHAWRSDLSATEIVTTSSDASTAGDFIDPTEGDIIDATRIRDVLFHNTGANDCRIITGISAPTATSNSKLLESGAIFILEGVTTPYFAIINNSAGNNNTVEAYARGVSGV